MSAITIRKGKFIQNGLPMPIEFGNKDQIVALEKHQKLISDYTIGMEVDFIADDNKTELFIDCICGSTIFKTFNVDADINPESICGEKFECYCGEFKYETYLDGWGEVMVKLC